MEKSVICPKCCKPNYFNFHDLKRRKKISCKFCDGRFVNPHYAGDETKQNGKEED